MTNYYIPIIYIVPLISVEGQASPRLFIAPEICHEKISYICKVREVPGLLLVLGMPSLISSAEVAEDYEAKFTSLVRTRD